MEHIRKLDILTFLLFLTFLLLKLARTIELSKLDSLTAQFLFADILHSNLKSAEHVYISSSSTKRKRLTLVVSYLIGARNINNISGHKSDYSSAENIDNQVHDTPTSQGHITEMCSSCLTLVTLVMMISPTVYPIAPWRRFHRPGSVLWIS